MKKLRKQCETNKIGYILTDPIKNIENNWINRLNDLTHKPFSKRTKNTLVAKISKNHIEKQFKKHLVLFPKEQPQIIFIIKSFFEKITIFLKLNFNKIEGINLIRGLLYSTILGSNSIFSAFRHQGF